MKTIIDNSLNAMARLGKGYTKTKDGHLRYTSPKELRDKYVHREVVERLIDQMPWTLKVLLPWPFEVHHMDFDKEHNCPSNLLVIHESLHSAMTAHKRNGRNGKFRPKWKKIPDWMPLYDKEDGEVPF